MGKKLTPNMENYLEAIKKINEKEKVVRVKGIAEELNVKMPSVTEALENLQQEGLIKHEKYGYIELTEKGSRLAEKIESRHKILFSFFTEILGIDPQSADEDACKIEHVISTVTLKRLLEFINFLKNSLENEKLENFKTYLTQENSSSCRKILKSKK